jgi:hypothetical protein
MPHVGGVDQDHAAAVFAGQRRADAGVHLRQGGRAWKKHLYVDANGEYHADLYTSEIEVLDRELPHKKVVGWLLNTDRKRWALCVPFESATGETTPPVVPPSGG